MMTKNIGTINWMAPELLQESGMINERTDVYSFGMVLFEIVSNLIPFYDRKTPEQIMFALVQGRRPIISKKVDSELSNLIRDCWKQSNEERPSIHQILVRLELRSLQPDLKYSSILYPFQFGLDFINLSKWKERTTNFRILEIQSSSGLSSNNVDKIDNSTSSPSSLNDENVLKLELDKTYSILNKMNKTNSFSISRLFGIYNRNMNDNFESKVISIIDEIERDIVSFKNESWKSDQQVWRKWMLDVLDLFLQKFEYSNDLDHSELKIVPLFHSFPNEEIAWKVCQNGFHEEFSSSFSSLNEQNELFGKGIYFTNNLEYCIESNFPNFKNEDQSKEYPVLLSFVLLGNVYPCVEDPSSSNNSIKGNPCQVKLKKKKKINFIFKIIKNLLFFILN